MPGLPSLAQAVEGPGVKAAIDLSDLVPPPEKPGESIELDTLIAQPNFAPRDWQASAPDWTTKPPVRASPDLLRVVDLPRRPVTGDGSAREKALVELMTKRMALPEGRPCRCAALGRDCIRRLRPAQAWALYEIGVRAGLLGCIGVGHGKTALDLLTPLVMPDCKLAVLLVPPGLVDQLVAEYELLGQHFRVPSLVIQDGRGRHWQVEGAPVLHVLPYSRLSRSDSTVALELLQPDTVIADECDQLRNREAARTKRLLRLFESKPETRFCGWTGSMTDNSITDYAHLSALALRGGSPLPLEPDVVDDWARALDASDWPAPAGALMALCAPGEHVRQGFHRRLVETEGVVSTSAPSLDGVEIEIAERPAPSVPKMVQEALDALRATWMRPDGEELVEAMAVARSACELACGFYYRWIFPRGESVALILEWLEARKQWNKELRTKLRRSEAHLDSPELCAKAAARAWGQVENADPSLPLWKAETWVRWSKVKGQVRPETEAVRLDPYLAEDAVEWARQHRGIVWYQNRAFGEWVAEIGGLPLHTGGKDAGLKINAERGDRSIVASIDSHGRGRDLLQYKFADQLVAQPPVSGSRWEQLLGRLHRPGQKAEIVRAWFYRHTPELEDHVDEALARALYVDQTLGSAQKLRVGFGLGNRR